MLIEIDEIHPPKVGGKVSQIVADGQKYEIWPEKLGDVAVGRRYEVEVREREFNGRTIRSISKIAPASKTATPVPAAAATASSTTGEAEYVGRVLAALIAAGTIDKQSIAAATAWLRRVWREQP